MSTTEKTAVRGEAMLTGSLADDPPHPVHGVAIGADETTVGMSGQKKFWPGEALAAAAETLSGKNIVKNHVNNDVDAVVGAVTEARYHPEYGVIYKGEIDETGLAEKVSRGRLDVSPRIIHAHVDELEENDDDALVVDDVKEFVNLALVPQGAAESNRIEIGHSGMLSYSQEELQEAFAAAGEASATEDGGETATDADDLDADEDLEIEDPVQSSEESAPASTADSGSSSVGVDLTHWTAEELQSVSVHKPSYSGTTEQSWNKPSKGDFDTDDLSDIADHYIVSKSGFPPDSFGDLALPVVEPSGELNLNAVQSAKNLAGQVDALSGDALDRVKSILNDLDESDSSEENNQQTAAADDDDEDEGTVSILQELDVLGADSRDTGETDVDLATIEFLH